MTLVVFQCQTDLTIWMQNPRCGLAPAFSVGGNLVKVLFRFFISPSSIALKPRKASCRGGNLSASQRDPRNSNVFWNIQSLCFSICLNQGQRHLSRLVVAGVFFCDKSNTYIYIVLRSRQDLAQPRRGAASHVKHSHPRHLRWLADVQCITAALVHSKLARLWCWNTGNQVAID